jgi:hypothetical protein
MFSSLTGFSKSGAQRKRLAQVKESSKLERGSICDRFQQVKDVDDQLAQIITDTRNLTSSIQEKLSGRLKITKNTIKSICQNLREGVVIVNYEGKVIEVNTAYEKSFIVERDAMIGMDFSEVIKQQAAAEADGSKLALTKEFFKNMSKSVFNRLDCKKDCDICTTRCDQTYFDGTFNPQNEAVISMKPTGKKPHMVAFSFSILDNEPESEEQVSYILFFKNLQRADDYTGKFKAYRP